jgi:hypothetical protein
MNSIETVSHKSCDFYLIEKKENKESIDSTKRVETNRIVQITEKKSDRIIYSFN